MGIPEEGIDYELPAAYSKPMALRRELSYSNPRYRDISDTEMPRRTRSDSSSDFYSCLDDEEAKPTCRFKATEEIKKSNLSRKMANCTTKEEHEGPLLDNCISDENCGFANKKESDSDTVSCPQKCFQRIFCCYCNCTC